MIAKVQAEATLKPCDEWQGLQWMLDREQKGYALERGHLHLHPAWLQLVAADGQIIYASAVPPYCITTDFVTAPVGGTCGGDCNYFPSMYGHFVSLQAPGMAA